MSDTSGIEAVDSVENNVQDNVQDNIDTAVGNDESSETGGHPAWKEILDVLPTSLHPIVTPTLEKWDQGVQERFNQVQSKYDGYEQYKDIKEQGISPEAITQAVQLQSMLANDPQGFYDRMSQYFNQGQEKNTPQDDDEYDISSEYDLENDPRYKQLQQGHEMLTQQMQQMMQQEADKQASAELETKLTALREKHGDFDEEYVLNYAVANGGDMKYIDEGLEKYLGLVGKIRGVQTPGSELPSVVAPGGATPSTNVDPATLDRKDTKSLVVNLLQQMHNQT